MPLLNLNNYDYDYIFKVIMIGNSNTGKSSILNRYLNNKFNDNDICTIGVDYRTHFYIYKIKK